MGLASLRLLRVLAWLAAAPVVVAGVAVWQVPRFLDWGQYRAAVESVASAGLGRPVRIAGPIRLSLLPQATLTAGDVFIADTGDGAEAIVGEMRIRVALAALLTGQVEPQDLELRSARMRLPWPLTGFTLRAVPVAALHARVEDGTLLIGGLTVRDVSGDLSAGGPGSVVSASGLASVLGRPWRMTGRLGQAGADGAATIEVSLDGLGPGVGTGGALTGQVAADGSVSGRITARGPDLSLLLPAPGQAWSADGRLVASRGLVLADELELIIGGSPARGAVALRLLPALRLDGALATNRLDLDAWLPPLLHGGAVALPTGIDLSAESAPMAGGTLRRLRAGFELSGDTVTLRESEAVLPGEAALQLSGTLAAGHFNGSVRVTAPDVPHTLDWLRPRAPALFDAWPAGAVHAAQLAASVRTDGDSVAFGGLAGDVDGVPISGDVAVRRGGRTTLAAALQLTGPVLDRWMPAAVRTPGELTDMIAALPRRLAALDSDVTLTAIRPVWHGAGLDRLVIDGGSRGGVVDIRQAALTGPGLSARVAGAVDGSGRMDDGAASVQLADATGAGVWLAAWPAGALLGPLLHGPATLDVAVSGPPGAWTTVVKADLSDLRLQATGRLTLPARWAGSVAVHHPGAPRLLEAVGLPGTARWLGDGSLSIVAAVDAAPRRVTLAGLDVSAGGLRGSGELVLVRPAGAAPLLTGTLGIETLPVPLPHLASSDTLKLDALHGGDARLTVRAAHVLWGEAAEGRPAAARLDLTSGVLRVDDIAAEVAGGALTGHLVVDSNGTPRLETSLGLAGATLDGPLFGTPVDVIAGVADGAVEMTATGYSPAAMLASARGPVRLGVRDGALMGIDAGRLLSVLQNAPSGPADMAPLQQRVAAALRQGATPFTRLSASGTLANGLFTVAEATIASPAAEVGVEGSIDVAGSGLDLSLTVQPALPGSPPIGLRLIGPAAAPLRTPGLADLARWQATR